ncbi:hypothetical protein DYB30_010997 [Aphanomyces astaci]|uniref:PDZ domain-containing protein n=1 Tax=Aphanomyces astaci TaxID=112090 RepID=A0A397E1A8_APHAT|nr:hypothetical protein DYB30_010997 [Aphanomyces astaci]RHY71963.1 hypothetical protein DYB38_008652 [Aphanomyces astaci]
MGMQSLLQAALIKMLVHSIRHGHVEGIRLTIEKSVDIRYIDKKGRNLLQLAIKQDTATRMQIPAGLELRALCVVRSPLAPLAWIVIIMYYYSAAGAEDVLHDLLRRGADVSFNRFGYCGDMDLLFPRIVHARSLLQHTEQLTHNDQVQRCWSIFHRHMQSTGYLLHTHTDVHTFQTPLKLSFNAPVDHSALDRIRIVDVHSPQPISQQLSKTFLVPPGAVGSFTLDAEVLHRPSLFHVYYEQHLAMPMPLPLHALERSLGVKDLDSGRTVSAQAANDAVLAALESMRSSCEPHHRVDIPTDDAESSTSSSVECTQVDNEWGGGCSYRCVAMLTLSLVPPTKPTKPHPHGHHFLYDLTVSYTGHIGLTLEGLPMDAKSHKVLLVVVAVSDAFGQLFPHVKPGDRLVAVNGSTAEYAGLQHTIWELKDARRPLVLQFQRPDGGQKSTSSSSNGLLARLRYGHGAVLAA